MQTSLTGRQLRHDNVRILVLLEIEIDYFSINVIVTSFTEAQNCSACITQSLSHLSNRISHLIIISLRFLGLRGR